VMSPVEHAPGALLTTHLVLADGRLLVELMVAAARAYC